MEKKEEIKEPQKESMDLWHSIKAFGQKWKKTKVIPEEYRLPERINIVKRYTPKVSDGLTQA